MTKFNFTTEKKAAYMAVTTFTTGMVTIKYFADWASFAEYHKFYKDTPIKVVGYHKDNRGWNKLTVFYV